MLTRELTKRYMDYQLTMIDKNISTKQYQQCITGMESLRKIAISVLNYDTINLNSDRVILEKIIKGEYVEEIQ